MMDLEFLRNLIEIVEDSDLDTIELEHEGTKIKLAKASGKEAGWSVNAPDLSMKDNPSPLVDEVVSTETVSTVEDETGANSNLIEVKSPMVGTLYAASSPDADNYVKVGSRVNAGDTLCILEAMKLMNELEAEVSGVIEEVCVQNGEPVQYGQVLFLLNPS